MQREKPNHPNEDADRFRRSIHDLAATLVAVRALAETLAEHVPTLVTMSRSKCSDIEAQIPAKTLDAVPSIPGEIVKLCEIARTILQEMGTTTRSASAHPRPPQPSRAADSPNAQVNAGRASILLVEDEDSVRFVISQALESKGCRVVQACDGEEALGLLQERDFDLILMDLRIPGLSGLETVKKIRDRESTRGRHTRIVGLTASPLLEDQQQAKAAGMDDVLVKPIAERTLQTLVQPFS